MGSEGPSAASIGQKLGHELRQYAVIAAYLYVCFGALILYKTAILRGEGVSYTPFGFAAIKALILGKFILMGHAAGLGDRYQHRSLVHVVARKSLLFLVMLLVLSVVEELVVGLIHGRTVAASLSEFAGGRLPETLASCVIVLLILVPYMAFREFAVVLGEGSLRQLLLERRAGPRSGGSWPGHASDGRKVSAPP